MTVRVVTRRGTRHLVIDIVYTNPDGTRARYRRDAEVQSAAAARAEERRRLAWLATTGSPLAPNALAGGSITQPSPVLPTPAAIPTLRSTVVETKPTVRFEDIVDDYLATFARSRLKPSTRHSYSVILKQILVPEPGIGERALHAIDYLAVLRLDARLVDRGAKVSTRRNVQSVLRSVLCRYAVECKLLDAPPSLPSSRRSARPS